MIMKEITEEQFEEFIWETIPCALFHVMPTDIDEETGARLDEVILIRLLHENPMVLGHRRLSWFIERFIDGN